MISLRVRGLRRHKGLVSPSQRPFVCI